MSKNKSSIAEWFSSPLGSVTLSAEMQAISSGLRRFHGERMLWLSPCKPNASLLSRCMVRHKFYGVLSAETVNLENLDGSINLLTNAEQLPLQTGSMDAIMVHHAIDCAKDSRAAMREISRILAPGGRLLLVGFNPLSVWWLRSLYAKVCEDGFSNLRFVNPYRVVDWLSVLGYEVDQKLNYIMYRPPLDLPYLNSRFWQRAEKYLQSKRIPVGGVYYLLFRKPSSSQPPLNFVHKKRHPIHAAALAKPVARHSL